MNISTLMSWLQSKARLLRVIIFSLCLVSSVFLSSKLRSQDLLVPDLGESPSDMTDVESQSELEARELSVSDQLSSELQKQFLYDADTIGFDRSGRRYLFRGDVVLIGRGAAIIADQISADYQERLLLAKGHVILLVDKQVFTGTKISLNWESGDFSIERAQLVVNDEQKSRRVIRNLLGMTDEEFAFEAARAARMKELDEKKVELKNEFKNQPDELSGPSNDLVDRYSLLLEQEVLLEKVTVPSLSRKTEKDRKTFLKRRRFWQQSRGGQLLSALDSQYYFQLSGQIVQRENQNDYTAINAKWSPCRCQDDDEEPVWGFQADRIFAQEEGYIEFEHPVLFVKGIPVLYIPYLKLPMKSRRQSGFLLPAIQTGSQINGFVYTQPVYFALSDHHDATVTTDIYQKRGTRFGLELRYKERDYSGFELDSEIIRDDIWLRSSLERNALRDYYLGAGRNFCDGQDDLCAERVNERLATPSNTWRGKNDWNARYFLTPRISFVSKGSIISDHRYLEDLYLPEDYVTAFSTRPQARAFSPAKAKVSYDGRDFHLGLSSLYGDSVLSKGQYSGQQMPLAARFISRTFPLYRSDQKWIPPLYASIIGESYYIRNEPGLTATSSIVQNGLGSGQWQRSKLSLLSPIKQEGALRVDYFWDSEFRHITHKDLDQKQSSIRSWRHGLTINLPIDGFGVLPGIFQDADSEGSQILHHIMNWSMTFSSRPVVVRDGPYGSLKDSNGASLVYFASDRDFLSRQDTRDVTNEDTMVTHQRVTLATNHRWRLFTRSWEPIYGVPPTEKGDLSSSLESDQLKKRVQTLHEAAFEELRASKDRRLTNSRDVFTESESGLRFHTNRYVLTDSGHSEPFYFNASITYDFALEKLRQDQIDANQVLDQKASDVDSDDEKESILSEKVDWINLPEPWLGPYLRFGLNWKGYHLSSQIDYNVYKKIATSSVFDLRLPSIYSTVLSFRYVDEKAPYLDLKSDELLFRQTQTRSVSLLSKLHSTVTAGITLVRRDPEEQDQQYASSLNVSYTDRSGCWGLRFVREKDLNQGERDANYVLQLSIIFLGNRQAADISPALKREIPHLTLRN